MRTAPEVTLPVVLERGPDAPPLPEQLARAVRSLVDRRALAAGDAVPSSRALAAHLGVSRGTVVAAYDQLLAEGYLVASAGRSTVVNPDLPPLPSSARTGPAPSPRSAGAGTLDLRPGTPDQDDVVGREWRAAWRVAAAAPLVPADPLGLPELRTAVSEHLRRTRAVATEPANVVVTAGGREGLALLLGALGAPVVGVEDPGFPSLRRVTTRLGSRVVSLPADERGLLTDALPEDPPGVVVVTPSHQYPLGGSLPLDRRLTLLGWARRRDVLVVEDDHDSELRYTSQPLPTLASLDPERVVLLGTFAKTLSPAMGIGYLVVPPRLLAAVSEVRADIGIPVSQVAQRALAQLLRQGTLRRHTHRMRRRYARRRALVLAELDGIPGVRVYPMDGGLHAVCECAEEDAVIAALAREEVRVAPLSNYWSSAGPRSGIVLGFGAAPEAELERGLRVISRVLRAAGVGDVS